jgi:hypothetical protein
MLRSESIVGALVIGVAGCGGADFVAAGEPAPVVESSDAAAADEATQGVSPTPRQAGCTPMTVDGPTVICAGLHPIACRCPTPLPSACTASINVPGVTCCTEC